MLPGKLSPVSATRSSPSAMHPKRHVHCLTMIKNVIVPTKVRKNASGARVRVTNSEGITYGMSRIGEWRLKYKGPALAEIKMERFVVLFLAQDDDQNSWENETHAAGHGRGEGFAHKTNTNHQGRERFQQAENGCYRRADNACGFH